METYTKKSKISRLPKYLAINFVRFQWKPTERTKAKILKRVQFPFELNMLEFCTKDLQEKLKIGHECVQNMMEKKAEQVLF